MWGMTNENCHDKCKSLRALQYACLSITQSRGTLLMLTILAILIAVIPATSNEVIPAKAGIWHFIPSRAIIFCVFKLILNKLK